MQGRCSWVPFHMVIQDPGSWHFMAFLLPRTLSLLNPSEQMGTIAWRRRFTSWPCLNRWWGLVMGSHVESEELVKCSPFPPTNPLSPTGQFLPTSESQLAPWGLFLTWTPFLLSLCLKDFRELSLKPYLFPTQRGASYEQNLYLSHLNLPSAQSWAWSIVRAQ